MRVIPASGSLGAFIEDTDLTAPLSPDELIELQQALADHLVVFVRNQPMTLDHLEQLTDQLGGRDFTPYVKPLDDRPYVIRVIKEAHDELNFANAWHSDLSYLEAPPSYTLLHAWDVPVAGGDTLWSNQYMAYDQLSAGLQTTLRGLNAVHSAGLAYGTGGYLEKVSSKSSMAIEPSADAYKTESHPIITKHPATGKPVLYLNPVYTQTIEGWNPVESAALLQHLYRLSVNENFTCRLHWERHTLAIWDNRCTMHNALNDYRGVRREMFRTSVKGSAPVAYTS
jgi:taurine dioxygenase